MDMERRELHVRAENAKDRDPRVVPISTRLAAVLEMANVDPAGRRYPASAYVFGLLGTPVKGIKKAWETCVLRAHGQEPQWLPGGKLSAESRSALARIDLHFHDLRHEAGSRWLEAGMPLHHIKEILGHANISQTDTYLKCRPHRAPGIDEAVRRRAWQTRGKVTDDRAPASWPRGAESNGKRTRYTKSCSHMRP